MERREFVTSAIAMAGVALSGAEGRAMAPSAREFYQLRKYALLTGPQLALTQNYFEHALIPALNRMAMAPVGAFKLDIGPETPTYYLLIPAGSVEALVTLDRGWPRMRSSSKRLQRSGERLRRHRRLCEWRVGCCRRLRGGRKSWRRKMKKEFFSCAPTRAQAMRDMSEKYRCSTKRKSESLPVQDWLPCSSETR